MNDSRAFDCVAVTKLLILGLVALLVLTLLAAAMVLPATAAAKVDKGYAKEYAAKVAEQKSFWNQGGRPSMRAYEQLLIDELQAMEELMAQGDPDPESVKLEQQNCEDQVAVWTSHLNGDITDLRLLAKGFRDDASPWFSSGADKITFRGAMNNIVSGYGEVRLAGIAFAQSFALMAKSPPDVPGATDLKLNTGNPHAKRGIAKIEKGLKAIAALQR